MVNLPHWAYMLRELAADVRAKRNRMEASGRATPRALEHANKMAGHLERAAQEIEQYLALNEAVVFPVWDVVEKDAESKAV